MKLNDEKFDELMFQLLEGEIQGEERQRLLDAIQADEHYNKQWLAWQHTILNPGDEMVVMNIAGLKKKEKKPLVYWWKYAAAAVIVLSVGFFLFNQGGKDSNGTLANPKLQIKKVPSVEPVTNMKKDNDSVVSYRKKVEMMVLRPESVPAPFVNPQETPVPVEIPKAFVENKKEQELKKVPEQLIEEEVKTVKPANTTLNHAVAQSDGVIMTVYSENTSKNSASSIGSKIDEKRTLLSRILSMPKLKIVNDSNTYTNKKLILENKAYKIIAGF